MNVPKWSRPPKILLIMGGFAQMGGIEIFARDLAEFLIRSGAGVTLAYWPIRGRSPILKVMKEMGCDMICGPVTRGVQYDIPDRALSLMLRKSAQDVDLVIFLKLFSDSVMASILDRLDAAKPSRIPSLYIPSFCPEEDETYRDRPKPNVALLNRIDSIMGQCSAMSCQVESFLGYQGRLWSIPLLSSIRSVSPVPLPEISGVPPRIQIAYIGRLTAQKNVAALLHAFGIFLEEHRPKCGFDMDLHLHGDGAEGESLRLHNTAQRYPDRVHFHGAYTSVDLPRIAAETHFFAQTTRFEGQCLAALEVMALGRPLLATQAGCLDEVLNSEDLGRVVKQSRPQVFAEAIVEMSNRVLAGRVQPEHISAFFRERFSREALEPRYLEMIWELLKPRGIEIV